MEHLETRGLLHENQFCFRKGRSCEETAHLIIKQVSESIESKEKCLAIFCDISKAFVTVNRGRLLNKLNRMVSMIQRYNSSSHISVTGGRHSEAVLKSLWTTGFGKDRYWDLLFLGTTTPSVHE